MEIQGGGVTVAQERAVERMVPRTCGDLNLNICGEFHILAAEVTAVVHFRCELVPLTIIPDHKRISQRAHRGIVPAGCGELNLDKHISARHGERKLFFQIVSAKRYIVAGSIRNCYFFHHSGKDIQIDNILRVRPVLREINRTISLNG